MTTLVTGANGFVGVATARPGSGRRNPGQPHVTLVDP